MAEDRVLQALEELEQALDANRERARLIKERIAHIRAERARGRSYGDIVPAEAGPLIVQLVTDSANALGAPGVRLRRAEARALYDDGMTMEQIAVLFGVTRQRVSALLRNSAAG